MISIEKYYKIPKNNFFAKNHKSINNNSSPNNYYRFQNRPIMLLQWTYTIVCRYNLYNALFFLLKKILFTFSISDFSSS